jgi:hypothetical protein
MCVQCGNDSGGKTMCDCCNAGARIRKEGLDKCDTTELLEWLSRRVYANLLDVEADRVVAIERQDFAKAFAAGEQMKVLQKITKDVDLARSVNTRG